MSFDGWLKLIVSWIWNKIHAFGKKAPIHGVEFNHNNCDSKNQFIRQPKRKYSKNCAVRIKKESFIKHESDDARKAKINPEWVLAIVDSLKPCDCSESVLQDYTQDASVFVSLGIQKELNVTIYNFCLPLAMKYVIEIWF